MVDKEEQSSLWGLSALTALGTGTGVGIYKNRSLIGAAIKSPIKNIGAEINTTGIGRFSQQRVINSSFTDIDAYLGGILNSYNSSIEQFSINSGNSIFGEGTRFAGTGVSVLRQDIRSAALESMLSVGRQSRSDIVNSLSVLNKMNSVPDIYRAAAERVSSAGGDIDLFRSRVEKLGNKVGYLPNRFQYLKNTISSPGGFIPTGPQEVGFERLSESARTMASTAKLRIGDALTGKNLTANYGYRMAGNTPMMVGDISGVHFSLPLENTGMTYSGKTLSAGYATRKAYNEAGQIVGYSEYALSKLTGAISGATGTEGMRANFAYLREELMGNANALAAATWLPPEEFATSGQLAMARLRGLEAVPMGEIGEDVITNNLLGKSVWPFASPSAAGEGVMSTTPLGEHLYGPLGKWVSAEQRPGQGFREWGLTEAGKTKLSGPGMGFSGTFGQYWNRLDRHVKGTGWDEIAGNHLTPQTITIYQKKGLKEEGFLSSRIADAMEYERTVQKKIALDADLNIHESLKGLKTAEGGRLRFENPITGSIGVETTSGRELVLGGKDLEMGQMEMIGAQMSGPNEATVYLKERRTLTGEAPWKMFSEENKYMLWRDADMEGRIAGQNIESRVASTLVERNKMALYNQQIEAMSMFLGNKIDTGKMVMNQEAEAFLRNPIHALKVSEIMEKEGLNAETALQNVLFRKAKSWGFEGKELGFTFGLTERSKLKEAVSNGVLTLREAAYIARAPEVIGIGKGMLGDLAVGYGTGAGGRGSLEQTGFRLLATKGEEGRVFATELGTRLEGKGQLAAARRMNDSVTGKGAEGFFKGLFSPDAPGVPLSELTEQNLFRKEGYSVDLGRKFESLGGSRLYIPGTDEADFLASKVIGNQTVQSPVTRELFSLQRAMIRGGAGEDELNATAMRLRTEIARNTEQQGAATGKVIGSKLLTGTRKNAVEDIWGIAEADAREMYDDLIKRAKTDQQRELLEGQFNALKRGEEATVGIWRHPTIGTESIQFARAKIDRELAAGMTRVPQKEALLQFAGEKAERVDVSALAGLAADTDRDQFVIGAIAEQGTIDKVKRRIATTQTEEYNQFLFNHYAMKRAVKLNVTNKSITELTEKEALEVGRRKLTTAKNYTGQVDVALQKFKIGLQYGAPEEYKSLAEVFEKVEQTMIAGKHGAAEYTGTLVSDIVEASEGKKGKLSSVFTALGLGKTNIAGTLGGKNYSFAFDPQRAEEVAMGAWGAVKKEVGVAMRSAAFAKGKKIGGITPMVLEEMANLQQRSPDVAQRLMYDLGITERNLTSKVSRIAQRGMAKTSRIMSAVKAGRVPMAIGAAAAAGIMLMAPSTAGTVRPVEGANAGRNLGNDSLDVPGGMRVGPPPPGPNASPKVYDSGGIRRTNRANINIQMRDLEGSHRNFMRSANQLSNSGRVNIRTRDDRSSLDPRRLAAKISERI